MSDLYDVPDGWEWKTINEVCTKVTDGAHKSPKTIDIGKPYITVRDVNNDGIINFNDCKFISDEDFDLLVKGNCKPNNGDVLFSKDGTVGKVALVNYDIEFVVLSSLAILKPSENILSNYLKNYLLSPYFLDKAIKSKTGAAIKRVVLKTIKELNIPLPTLSEQKRIVSKLDNLFEKIDKSIELHQKNMDEADLFMGSVLNEIFVELEEKFDKKLWKDILTIKNGKHYKDVLDENGIYPIYGSGGVINYANDYICNENSVIIGRKGTINSPLFVKEKFWNIDTAFGLEANIDKLLPMFLFYFSIRFNFLDLNKSTTLPSLAKSNLLQIEMVLPPLQIQQKIVKYLDEVSEKIEKVKSIQKEKMDNLKALKASILDKAFRGEL
ncbi:MAG: hypothetical protein CL623_00955 [Arcobacter sp.]|nr:hypothetical protein [Arcobacter sp.]|tara:strand:+ start:1174 stop:2319 length:1146 start_codon:yes stop_codon:yes gene_type:complete